MSTPYQQFVRNNGGGPAFKAPDFDEWMRAVNLAVLKKTGLHADDLPDYCYRNAFDAGQTPTSTAKSAIRAAKDY